MLLRLQAIKFNHDPSSATVDAFNIRKNEKELVCVPEWCGVSINPKDSPAAYALCETRNNTLIIKASVSCGDENVSQVRIRALDANFHHQEPASDSALSPEERELLRTLSPNPMGNILGEVEEKDVKLVGGESGFQPFNLGKVRIWDTGVAVENIVWRWQYLKSGDWIDLAVTTHRIYTALQLPKPPWQPTSQDLCEAHLPWVEVLEQACDWARSAKNPDDAAERITQRVNGLGPNVIHFDNFNHASSHYSSCNNFDCMAFLYRLQGKTSLGPKVNCSDCAAIVSTFANSIGCDLEQSVMSPIDGLNAFQLNEHLRIGIANRVSGAFIYHEVAWEGQAKESDEVFDACVQVNIPNTPGSFSPVVPTNLLFGAIGQPGYRFRLVRNGCEKTCRVRPELKIRRRLGPQSRPKATSNDLDLVRDVYDYDSWKESKGPGTPHFIIDYSFGDFALPGWHIVSQRRSGTRGKRPFIQSFWKRTEGTNDVVLRIDVCEGSVWTDAREVLLTFLREFQLPGIELQKDPELGDVALAGPEPFTILFGTANFAYLVRNVGRDVLPVRGIAAVMSEKLLNPPPLPGELNASFKFAKEFRFENDKVFLGDRVRIVEESCGSVPQQFYQFVSPIGEMSLCGEKLFYRPLKAGEHMLDIFAVNKTGSVLMQQLPLTVQNS